MNRILEGRFGRGLQSRLRGLEERRLPKAARERDLYERQQQLLSSPVTRDTYIQSLKQKVAVLIPPAFIPDESILRRHEITSDMYFLPIRRKRRAFQSDHNIAHQTIVMVGALMGIQYLKSQNPTIAIDEEAVITAAGLHDTQRFTDVLESVAGLELHGMIGARRTVALMKKMHVSTQNTATVEHVKKLIRYHDVDKKVLGAEYTAELGVMVASDRAALGRLFSSASPFVRMSAGYLAGSRMREFSNGGIASDPALFAQFTEILSALDIMVKEKIAHGDTKQQFQYVVEAAKALGIVKDTDERG